MGNKKYPGIYILQLKGTTYLALAAQAPHAQKTKRHPRTISAITQPALNKMIVGDVVNDDFLQNGEKSK